MPNLVSTVDRWRSVFAAWALASAAATCFGQPAPFTEEAASRGLNYQSAGCSLQFGCGAAFVDLDGDLDPDVVVVGRADGVVGVFENDGTGQFIDRSIGSGIPQIPMPSGVSAGDYDGDGDLDLHLSNWWLPDLLMENLGGFQFADVTEAAGITDAGPGTGCTWGDYDGDGWVDLYVSNRRQSGLPGGLNTLYRNNGDRTFTDVSAAMGVDDDHLTYQSVFFDADRDGDADLYLSNDKSEEECVIHNRLFENVGTGFVDITEASGTAACIDSMGLAVGDFDSNGLQDLFCTDDTGGADALFMGETGPAFVESGSEAGVASSLLGWGAVFADFDNNSYLDLYVCNFALPNALYRNDGTFPTEDVAAMMDIDDAGGAYVVAVADIDADGDIDLLLQNNWQRTSLYINHEGESRNWVRFAVAGRGPNRFGVGAIVETRVGSKKQIREVIAGSNYKAQNELVVHFGLGGAAMIDEITVMWPGGSTRSVTHLTPNNLWTLYAPEHLGDGNHDGFVSAPDYNAFVPCVTGATVGALQPGCEMMDFDGDGDVDLFDFGRFQARFRVVP